MENLLIIFTFSGAILALLFALFTARRVLGFSEGTDKMKKISKAVRAGANAYLKRQYSVVLVFFIVLFI